jgi:hypothetical protein
MQAVAILDQMLANPSAAAALLPAFSAIPDMPPAVTNYVVTALGTPLYLRPTSPRPVRPLCVGHVDRRAGQPARLTLRGDRKRGGAFPHKSGAKHRIVSTSHAVQAAAANQASGMVSFRLVERHIDIRRLAG